MDDSQKLDRILRLLDHQQSAILDNIRQIHVICPVCNRVEWIHIDDGISTERLAALMRFLLEHATVHEKEDGITYRQYTLTPRVEIQYKP